MLAFAFLLLIGFHGPASPPWRIYVNPGESMDTFHIAYPAAWNLERRDGSIVVASPNGEVGLTVSLHAGKGDTPDACAAAHLQDRGGAFTSTPIRQSLINMNWRAVSLEARGRLLGEEEDTVRYSACLESSPTPSHPLVSITSTAGASAFDRHRDVIVRIFQSVRFRPAA
jgi:hypothetical protein